jgi:excisionase family DNA binding protein
LEVEEIKGEIIINNNIIPEVYTVAEIQKLLKISKNVAYDLIKENLFPVIKIKSVFRIPKKSFHEWLDNLKTE